MGFMTAVVYLPALAGDETPTQDGELVERALAGDRRAGELLYRRHAQPMNRLARRLAINEAEAEDLAQEVFAQAFFSLQKLQDPNRFGGWLRSIMVRTAAKKLRRHRITRRLGLAKSNSATFWDAQRAGGNSDAEVELRRVYAVVDALPAAEGIALILHRLEGWTHAEIAARQEVSVPTVKRRIKRAADAIAKLRREEA